jgi:hypothetical protein
MTGCIAGIGAQIDAGATRASLEVSEVIRQSHRRLG